MTQFTVEPEALLRFAAGTSERADTLDDVRQRLYAVRVPRSSFGYVPGIGNRVHEAYEEFVDGCTETVVSAADSMAEIAEAVRAVVDSYQTSDQAAEQAHQAVRNIELRGL